MLQVKDPAKDDHQRHDHGKPGEDRTCHEVGRENRRVPPRDHRHREIETHNVVDRKHQRRRQPRQQQIGLLVVAPLAIRPAPSEAQKTEDAPPPGRLGAVIVAKSGIRPTYQNMADTIA